MKALMFFLKEFLGIGLLPDDHKYLPKKKVKRTKTQDKVTSLELTPIGKDYWWYNPVHKNDNCEFQRIDNSVLYDELLTILNESRLEIIELPETISAIMKKIHQKQFWYTDIIELIENSPGLAGDFLSLVNSAAFSRGQFIYDLNQALPRLGRKKIQSILFLNASKMSIPETPLFQKVCEEVISQSQAVAKICRIMSSSFGINQNEAFLAGLLHNIGKIGLLKQIYKHYNLPKDIDEEYHQSIFNSIIPLFESKAAQKICQYWKLETQITNSICQQAKLDNIDRSQFIPENLKLMALVNLAVYLGRVLGYGDSLKEADPFKGTAASVLKFSNNPRHRQLLAKVYDAFQEKEEVQKNIA